MEMGRLREIGRSTNSHSAEGRRLADESASTPMDESDLSPHDLLPELVAAFNTLVSDYPAIVVHFQEAFDHRRMDLSLVESTKDGLTSALVGLLARPVEEQYLVTERYSHLTQVDIDPDFVERFRTALMQINDQHHLALEWMEKRCSRKGISTLDLLRALLQSYVDNKLAYPY